MSDAFHPFEEQKDNPENGTDEFEIPVKIIEPVSSHDENDEKVDDETGNIEELRDRWLRAEAEIENIQKRTVKRIELARNRERQDILLALLDIADSFERALSNQSGENSTWREGMKAIQQQLLTVLKRFGAEPMDIEGKQFDPNYHEAVAVVDDSDHREDEIVSVMQTGYMMNDGTLLRAAKVVVVKNVS